jgi:hypothetical protein
VTAQHLVGFGHIIRFGTWPGMIAGPLYTPGRISLSSLQ